MIILSVKCQTNSSKLTLTSDIGKMQFSDQLAPVSPTYRISFKHPFWIQFWIQCYRQGLIIIITIFQKQK